jgi:hypothetical protein
LGVTICKVVPAIYKGVSSSNFGIGFRWSEVKVGAIVSLPIVGLHAHVPLLSATQVELGKARERWKHGGSIGGTYYMRVDTTARGFEALERPTLRFVGNASTWIGTAENDARMLAERANVEKDRIAKGPIEPRTCNQAEIQGPALYEINYGGLARKRILGHDSKERMFYK